MFMEEGKEGVLCIFEILGLLGVWNSWRDNKTYW